MPDIRTGFTRTQVAAEPESSKQSKELACHKIHLYGKKKRELRLLLFGLCVSFPYFFQILRQGASQTWMFSSVEHSFGGGARDWKDNHTLIWYKKWQTQNFLLQSLRLAKAAFPPTNRRLSIGRGLIRLWDHFAGCLPLPPHPALCSSGDADESNPWGFPHWYLRKHMLLQNNHQLFSESNCSHFKLTRNKQEHCPNPRCTSKDPQSKNQPRNQLSTSKLSSHAK